MHPTLADLLSLACALFLIIEVVRTLPWPEAWRHKRPLNCTLCLVWWHCLLVALATGLYTGKPLAAGFLSLAVGGLALLLLYIAAWLKGWSPPAGPPAGSPPV